MYGHDHEGFLTGHGASGNVQHEVDVDGGE